MIFCIIFSISAVSANNQDLLNVDDVSLAETDSGDYSSEIYVNGSVSESGNGSFDTPYKTISEAINTADTGSIINIASGTYSGNDNVGLTIDKELSIVSYGEDNVVLDGEDTYLIFTVSANRIYLDNIVFKNGIADRGGAIYFTSFLNNSNFTNCIFESNTANMYGGAINFYDGISNCNFINCSFTDNNAVYGGGVITSYTSYNNSFINCTFTDNRGSYGGVTYYADSSGDDSFINCTFSNNIAEYYGGGVFYYWGGASYCNYLDCNFTVNTADNNNDGGVICYNGESRNNIISNSNFINNTARYGGAVCFYTNSNDNTFISSNFINNSVSDSGGAIYFWSSSFENISGSCFINNSASYNGGAIYFNSNSNDNILNSSFYANNASSSGGAIYFNSDSNFNNFSNLNFTSNTAGSGGAVYFSNSLNNSFLNLNFTFNNATSSVGGAFNFYRTAISNTFNRIYLENNMAKSNGAGFYISNSQNNSYSNLTFIDNTANAGGGIYISGNSTNDNLIDFNFTNNGARAIFAVSVFNTTFNSSYFEKNKGIAIYIRSALADSILSNLTFINNTGRDGSSLYCLNSANNNFTNLTFINNTASENGGAVMLGNCSGSIFTDSTFIDNTADEMGGAIYVSVDFYSNLISNSIFTNNTAGGKGGVIYFEADTADNNFTNITFTDNYAAYGGVIAYEDVSVNNTIFKTSEFINNTAHYGGAIAFYNTASISTSFTNSTFKGNSATASSGTGVGGAICYYGGDAYCVNNSFINSTFIENQANYGASLYIVNYCINGTFINVNFTGNNATYNGGAVYFRNSTSTRIVNSTFENNRAGNNGGALFYIISSSDNTVSNSSFVNNSAGGLGGAVYFYSESAGNNFTNLTFINNSAGSGGGMYFTGTSTGDNILQSLFINNTAKTGSAFYFNSNSDTVIKDSILINNNGTNVIYSRSGNVTADYNWFGSNSTNYANKADVSDNVVLNNWLFINSTSNSSQIKVGENTTVKFIIHSYDSYTVSDYDYSNLIKVNLTLSTINAYADKKYAQFGEEIIFTATDIDEGNITADYNNISQSITMQIEKAYSSVNISDAEIIYGNTVNLTAECVNAEGIVAVLYDSDNITVELDITVSEFNVVISGLDAGNYTLNITTITSDNYYNSTDTSKIIVNKANSTVYTEDIEVAYNENIELTAHCVNATGVIAEVYDKSSEKVNASISIDEFKISVAGLNAGIYTLNVTTLNDNNHVSTSNLSKIIVNKINTTLILNSLGDITPRDNQTIAIILNVNITGNLTYSVNGEYMGIVENNSILLCSLTEGEYNVEVELLNDTNYNYVSNSTSFNVSKIKADINLTCTDIAVTDINVQIIDITLPGDATGNITLSIGDNESVIVINNTAGEFIINNSGLKADNYTVKLHYSGDDKYNSSQITSNLLVSKISDYNITYEYINHTIIVNLPQNSTGNVSVEIANYTFVIPVNDSIAICNISNLSAGDYNITISYRGNDIYAEGNISGNISLKEYSLAAPEVIKYYKSSQRFYAYLYDENSSGVAGENITLVINNMTYYRITDENGSVSLALNLNRGEYLVNVSWGNISVNSSVTIKTTVNGSDVTKIYRNSTQYWATFRDSDGSYLDSGTSVQFNINGVIYTRNISTDTGLARLNINLAQGNYTVTVINPINNESSSNTIVVLPSVTNSSDLVKYYRNSSHYYVSVLDDEGNNVGAGVNVTFNINGVFYTRQTNTSGIAGLNINLQPGKYIITAEYNGCKISNNITVLPVLSADDLNMSYMDGSAFNVRLVDGVGNPAGNERISFNINGVVYYRLTNSSGIAHLNINLIHGQYTITSAFNGTNIANTIKII